MDDFKDMLRAHGLREATLDERQRLSALGPGFAALAAGGCTIYVEMDPAEPSTQGTLWPNGTAQETQAQPLQNEPPLDPDAD